ncbi:hypothetical protein MATL_G00208050 [Megalops atlanticus]|uniref:GTP cyclohydrolase 1 feedback regulatory protein n=1 Tax=Megalops atlanticus TaxID=7932 RepID=A0A9D3T4L8_MEGAT|nr:hypothetical protein MATL_G00208050 [Megalops atlanticus]
MPYVFVSSELPLETGPTTVGDTTSDRNLMQALGATLGYVRGNKSRGGSQRVYFVENRPREVLDKLELYGYRLLSTSVAANIVLVWCLYKEAASLPSTVTAGAFSPK